MPIRVWDCQEELEAERADLLGAIEKVLRSGRLILGDSLQGLEEAFAAYCGVRFGVGVDNATNGLALALRALGIVEGDEVITVANAGIPTVSAIVTAGATPRFVDVDPTTHLMDVARIPDVTTGDTKAVVPVHLYGQCVDMTALRAAAASRGWRVVEDCAQCHGATQAGRRAGAMSDLSVFSFYPTKVLGALGDAGMVLTDDERLRDRLRRLRCYGMAEPDYAVEHGYNSRMDEIQAEILLRRLPTIEHRIACRQRIARRYQRLLAHTSLGLPQVAPDNRHVFYQYVVRHPERDRLLAALERRDIHLTVRYRWPAHLMPAYAGYGRGPGSLPHTEAAAREVFSLPMYPALPGDTQTSVCRALCESLGVPLGE